MKKSRKILALCLALAMVVLCFTACGDGEKKPEADAGNENKVLSIDEVEKTVSKASDPVAKKDIKVGFIFLHDENSTYDKNFMDAAAAVQKKLGLTDDQVIYKVNIPEGDECYNAAAELVDAGCDVIFADSFGHEPYMLKAAKEFPEVQFCHATGTNAQTALTPNFHNAFASIYEGRFLAGVAAGMKLNEMIESGKITAEQAKIGYVGAFPYAEVKSGFTSFFLGARYICPSVTMEVKYTNSWFDIALEKESALALIKNKCVLISQHADSEGAPKACEENNIPNIAYNIDTAKELKCENTAIISSKINWAPYFELMINSVIEGKAIPVDWCGGIKEGSVQLTALNEKAAAEGTQAKIDEIKGKLEDGSLNVFDTETFKVGGKKLDTYLADVVSDDKFTPDSEAIIDGEFSESTHRSAPYFDIIIDGITEI
ncbi:MAG: BMP family ABC transporter substrate-binding protein [Ruminococcaceae bacterium]|nr:BMP family ABC transporter substrate-binding protein [Oscillospiraceae bacterium]